MHAGKQQDWHECEAVETESAEGLKEVEETVAAVRPQLPCV